eukprot:GILI01010801.1.p1 GENE.GILI01010801.1~~GILI01010801.1.p1  ORF type:complete len:513 (+),score=57.92 GILI01010801.1:97-1539(+)
MLGTDMSGSEAVNAYGRRLNLGVKPMQSAVTYDPKTGELGEPQQSPIPNAMPAQQLDLPSLPEGIAPQRGSSVIGLGTDAEAFGAISKEQVGTVSAYLNTLDEFKKRAEDNKKSDVGVDYGPNWWKERELHKRKDLKNARLFVEEVAEKKNWKERRAPGSNSWVTTQHDAHGFDDLSERRGTRGTHRKKMDKLLVRSNGSKGMDTQRREEADRAILRPYSGGRALADPALANYHGNKVVVNTDTIASRERILAHDSRKRNPGAPWQETNRSPQTNVRGVESRPNATGQAVNNVPHRPRLSESAEQLWASDEAVEELAKLHRQEEDGESQQSDTFADLHPNSRSVRSNLTDEKRSFGGSASHLTKVDEIVNRQGPLKEGLRSMQRRLEKDHGIHMSKSELDWYNKTAGKTVQDYDLFQGESKLKMHMSDTRIASSLYSQERMQIGNESRISYRAQPVGLMRKYGRQRSHGKTPGVLGREVK